MEIYTIGCIVSLLYIIILLIIYCYYEGNNVYVSDLIGSIFLILLSWGSVFFITIGIIYRIYDKYDYVVVIKGRKTKR